MAEAQGGSGPEEETIEKSAGTDKSSKKPKKRKKEKKGKYFYNHYVNIVHF